MVKIFFSIFEYGHYAADQVYFYESNSQKFANLAAREAHARQSFNQRVLKNEYLFVKICKYLPVTSKNNR